MNSLISRLMSDPKNTIIALLLSLPGLLLALSAHEFAHGYVADRCGDHTARNLGRLTINPLRHLDLLGTLMMIFVGFGWAKPVPVNPRNYRHYRRDDLLVSMAGVTMNFLLFLAGCVAMYAILGMALHSAAGNDWRTDLYFLEEYGGEAAFYVKDVDYTYLPISTVLRQAPYVGEFVIGNAFGEIAMYLYEILGTFVSCNLVLAVFNLLPIPPLDGYHLLNHTVLRRANLFASRKVTQIASGVLLVLMFTGLTGRIIGWVENLALSGVGALAGAIFRALGIL